LVDEEAVTLSNLQRYVLATQDTIGKPKVEIGKRVLSAARLSVDTEQTTLETLADRMGVLTVPTFAVSIDNVPGRRAAQALLPRLAINGWTGEEALGASWHLFSRDAACLACLYFPHRKALSATEQAARAFGLSPDRAAQLWVTQQPLSDSDIASAARALGVDVRALDTWRRKSIGHLYTDVVCGAVPIGLTGLGRVETVPLAHQSALAGILMAAELVKRTDATLSQLSQDEPLLSWDNVLRPPPAIWTRPRPRELGCICGDEDYQAVYRTKWGQGRSRSRPL